MTGANEKLRFYAPVALLIAGAIGIGVRLVLLHLNMVMAHSKQPNYGFTRNTLGARGTIYCSIYGTKDTSVLAQTKTVWDYHLDAQAATRDPTNPKKPISPELRREKMQTLSDVLQIPLVQVMDAYAKRISSTSTNLAKYVYLATSDDDGIHAVLSDPKRRFNELAIDEKQVRVYPQGRRLSHVLGFVNRDSASGVGSAGIEQVYERLLKGMPGTVRGTRIATGGEARVRREIDVDARPGNDVYLTVDPNIQYEVEQALRAGVASNKAERAWSIVLSVKTGAVLAMACLPDYDPSEYNKSSAAERFNGAISENYEPGSVMKTITACAVLNEGVVGPDTMMNTAQNDPNYYRLPGDLGHKWEERMSVREALVHSSNIVFGKLGVDLGPKRLWTYMTEFGLGRRTGIGDGAAAELEVVGQGEVVARADRAGRGCDGDTAGERVRGDRQRRRAAASVHREEGRCAGRLRAQRASREGGAWPSDQGGDRAQGARDDARRGEEGRHRAARGRAGIFRGGQDRHGADEGGAWILEDRVQRVVHRHRARVAPGDRHPRDVPEAGVLPLA